MNDLAGKTFRLTETPCVAILPEGAPPLPEGVSLAVTVSGDFTVDSETTADDSPTGDAGLILREQITGNAIFVATADFEGSVEVATAEIEPRITVHPSTLRSMEATVTVDEDGTPQVMSQPPVRDDE